MMKVSLMSQNSKYHVVLCMVPCRACISHVPGRAIHLHVVCTYFITGAWDTRSIEAYVFNIMWTRVHSWGC